jgi:uncharacterized protein YegP (UPF0339 family)
MSQKTGYLEEAYASRFGKPKSKQEAHGYWLFASGLVLGLAGLFVLAYSTMVEPGSSSAFGRRQIAAVLGGAGLPLLMLGIVYRLPIEKAVDRVALVGTAVCLAAVAAFVVYYPGSWNLPAGSTGSDMAPVVTGVYGVGLLVVGFAALVIPSMIDRKSELDRREDEVFRREGEASGREEEVSTRENEVAEREEKETEESNVTVSETPEKSKAKFEMFKDAAGEWRWNLRHNNGNIIADSAEGYSSKAKAKQGLESVRKNVSRAPVTQREEAAMEESADEEDESGAKYELYEDNAGQWRWRLVAPNGLIIADSGQGYADRRDAESGIGKVRMDAGDADHLDITPAGFEVYNDAADEWRWRLIRQNGRIIADSGQGYTERNDAVEAVERAMSGDADTEVYEDEAGEHRWRLVAGNGRIIADSGQGYSSEVGAREAVDRFEEIAPKADTVEEGAAQFTVYKDAADEWRWRLVSPNGNIVADSAEGYTERNDAVEALKRVRGYSTAPAA